MSFAYAKRRRQWLSADHKHRFAARNDVASLERSLTLLRKRNPPVGRVRSFLIRMLGGTVGRPDEVREIRRLTGLLDGAKERLLDLEEAVGWDPRDEV